MVSWAHSVCISNKPINKHGKRVIHNDTNSVASSINKQTNKTKQTQKQKHSKRNKTWNTVSGSVVCSKGGSRNFLFRGPIFRSENTGETLFVANRPLALRGHVTNASFKQSVGISPSCECQKCNAYFHIKNLPAES